MTRKCGWCGKHMGTNDIGDPNEITHGICPKCQRMIRQDLQDMTGKPALEPLDTYDLIEH